MLRVNEVFHSIQTEGPYVGNSATFIRLAGCNLTCPFCDTDHKQYDEVEERVLVDAVDHMLVVITGGEPFEQNLGLLLALLVNKGIFVQIETNGTVSPFKDRNREQYNFVEDIINDIDIVCSPKLDSPVHPDIVPYICAYKVLCNSTTTLHYVQTWKDACSEEDAEVGLYLQPLMCDSQAETDRNISHTVELCKLADVKLSLQYHKMIHIP